LLAKRTQLTTRLFRLIVTVLLFTFVLAVFLIWEHYRRLAGELQQRTIAEQRAQGLSYQVLHAQDEERRRISRELHDGLGQNLSVAKMMVESFMTESPNERSIAELAAILDESLTGTRTMSYLLHPPLLDEVGLASAAEWFIEGFSKRTGIAVTYNVKGNRRRLPQALELTLFRILQESLTNIQRHAQCTGADVVLSFNSSNAALQIQDHGVGISAEKLKHIEKNGNQLGLGLTGMKQRAQEQGGTFRLSSNSNGTTIQVELPGRTERDGAFL
jgi:two-component system NarL family sensor kinase